MKNYVLIWEYGEPANGFCTSIHLNAKWRGIVIQSNSYLVSRGFLVYVAKFAKVWAS